MRAKKKASKPVIILKRIVYSVLAVVLTAVIFFELTVRDRIELVIIAQIKTLAHTAINDAVNDYIKDNESICNNLVSITTDDSYQIKSISENSYNVNVFKTDLSTLAQSYIEKKMANDGLDVKLGNFTGLTILSDDGPFVHFNIESTPTISCEIISTFESAGVNQTIHHIKLVVYVDIYVGNPFRIESIAFDDKFEIAQTIIVGSIPSAYGTISRY